MGANLSALDPGLDDRLVAANCNRETIDGNLGFKLIDSQAGLQEIFATLNDLGADHGAIIKMQTWRGDGVGMQAAQACEQALARGAEVKLFKDGIGAAFEFAERAGLSFWHDSGERRLLDGQARLVRDFYQNGAVEVAPEVRQAVAEQRSALKGFARFEHESGYRYDHSKLVLVYDKRTKTPLKGFVGGACFGDEWGDGVPDQNFDGVLCITDPAILKQLVRSLKGMPDAWQDGVKVLTNSQRHPESYYSTIRKEVLAFSGAVEAAIAYMGKADLIQLFENKASARLIMPFEANINQDRNWHFMYEMMRRVDKDFGGGVWGRFEDGRFLKYWCDFLSKTNQNLPANMEVIALDRMSHLKAIVCEGVFAAVGSANMVGENSFNEAGVAFKGGASDKADAGIEQIRFLLRRAARHRHQDQVLQGVGINYWSSALGERPAVPRFSLRRSQTEHAVMAFQAFMARWRRQKIGRTQKNEQAWFCQKFPDA